LITSVAICCESSSRLLEDAITACRHQVNCPALSGNLEGRLSRGKLSRISQAAIVGSSYNYRQLLVLPKYWTKSRIRNQLPDQELDPEQA